MCANIKVKVWDIYCISTYHPLNPKSLIHLGLLLIFLRILLFALCLYHTL